MALFMFCTLEVVVIKIIIINRGERDTDTENTSSVDQFFERD